MTNIEFIAPDGSGIAGIVQRVTETPAWAVTFLNPDAAYSKPGDIDYAGSGPESADWESLDVGDMPVFEDTDGTRWLPHHLVRLDQAPNDPETYCFSAEYCGLAAWETQLALIHADVQASYNTLRKSGSGASSHLGVTLSVLGSELSALRYEAATMRAKELAVGANEPVAETMAEPLPLATMQLYRALAHSVLALTDTMELPKDITDLIMLIEDADPSGEPGWTLAMFARDTDKMPLADRIWPSVEWSDPDQDAANAHGWELVLDESTGCLEIDIPNILSAGANFDSARDAFLHVEECAKGDHGYGDDYTALCKRAIQHNGVLIEG